MYVHIYLFQYTTIYLMVQLGRIVTTIVYNPIHYSIVIIQSTSFKPSVLASYQHVLLYC